MTPGQVVGFSTLLVLPYDGVAPTEWSNGQVINLRGLPGSHFGEALGINDAGQVVGESLGEVATEWSNGQVINLGGLTGSTARVARSINDVGQVVGFSVIGGSQVATEWSNGQIIDLGGLPGFNSSEAFGINDAGQVVGFSAAAIVPEPSTWAMMLLGFAGLGFVGDRTNSRVNVRVV
jgi:probable HAF family extracellular repeat protein